MDIATAPSGSSHRRGGIAVQQQPLKNEPGFMNARVLSAPNAHAQFVAGTRLLLFGSISAQMAQLRKVVWHSSRRPE